MTTNETLTMEDAVELVGIDACTEARNGAEQLLDDGRTLFAEPDGSFKIVQSVMWVAEQIAEEIEDAMVDLLPELLPPSLRERIYEEENDAMCDSVFDEVHAAFRAGCLEMARKLHAIGLRHR